MANSLPINLIVDGRRCVVIGEVAVADGKVQILESRGADVVVITPAPDDAVLALAAASRITLHRRDYETGDLAGAFFVVCGAADEATTAAVQADANKAGILINVVDDTPRCEAIFPAVVRRGALQISVSTDGRSPAVAVRVKEQLEREFGEEYATLLQILGDARPQLAGWRTQADRARLWYEILDSGILQMIRSGQAEQARRTVADTIAAARREP